MNNNINLKEASLEELIKELESRGYKATKVKSKLTKAVTDNKELLNPVITIRDLGEDKLREKLNQYELKELIKICRTYTRDANGTIYRSKKPEKVIDYIILRASKMSTFGQCFRTCTDDTKINY